MNHGPHGPPTNSLKLRQNMMSNYLPLIGITMGDAAGVGPEIVVKSLTHDTLYRQCRPVVIGDARRLEEARAITGSDVTIRRIAQPSEARTEPGTIDCIDLDLVPAGLPFGKLSS